MHVACLSCGKRYERDAIQERVEDLAGTLKIRSAPNKGVAIDIRIPLLNGGEDDKTSEKGDKHVKD